MERNSVQGKTGSDLVGAVDKGDPAAVFVRDKKAYDPLNRGFHRVKFTGFDTVVDSDPSGRTISKVRPPGRGYDCGCRSTEDFTTSSLFDSIISGVVDGLKTAVLAGIPGAKEAEEKLEEQFKDEDGDTLTDRIKKFLANGLEGLFFRSFLVHIPSWAPVNRRGFGPDFDSSNAHNVVSALVNGAEVRRESEVEVEGFLTRSYLTRHHRPYTQWSHYYHWSFQVEPAPGFKHLVGLGDLPSPEDRAVLAKRDELDDDAKQDNPLQRESRTPGNRLYLGTGSNPNAPSASSIECLLDLGVLSKPPSDHGSRDITRPPSILFDKRWPFWPQTGDYFWASGRFVYDCTHPTSAEKNPARNPGVHPTLINPVKAFAVTRYEAFKFDELDEFVPATRFMFFVSRKGGYVDFDDKSDIKLTDQDYEFIVDLPPLEDDVNEFAVGRTPQFNLNTIVARPRLLKSIEFAPYGTGADSLLSFVQGGEGLDPIVQLVRPEPGKLPRQLRVKVPMSKMPSGKDAFGFVLTVGWADERQVAKVKKVVVKLPELVVRDRLEQLRLNICVNGRWIFFPTAVPVRSSRNPGQFRDIRDGSQQHPGPEGLIFHMPDDGRMMVTAHGMKRNDFGKFIEEKPTVDPDPEKDRMLAVGGIIQIDDATAEAIREAIEEGLGEHIPDGVFDEVDKVKEVLSNENIKKVLGAAAADLLGTRRNVDWRRDVDSIEADPKQRHQLASAIAREMKVFPVFNKANEAMGMVEEGIQSMGSPTVVLMSNLAARIKLTINPVELAYHTMEVLHPEETGFLVVKGGPEKEKGDYVLHVTMAPSEQDAAPAV